MKLLQTEPVAEVTAPAYIQSITVADDGSRVEIVTDKPIVYTYYMLESPPRVIVDIAQTAPGKQTFPLIVNKAGVVQIDISKHEFGSGVLSRIDITLNSKAEITAALDKLDKNKLILFIPVPAAEKLEPVSPAAVVSTMTPEVVPAVIETAESKKAAAENQEPEKQVAKGESQGISKSEVAEPPTMNPGSKSSDSAPVLPPVSTPTAIKPGERVLTSITKVFDGLLLETSIEPESYKAFKLTQPDRLVIDIPKTKNAIANTIVDVNAFSLGKARVG
jgi:hypothetical protein